MSRTPEEMTFRTLLADLPVVAILRGLQPGEAADVGEALTEAGIRLIEVPLNRPGALEAMAILVGTVGAKAMIGAGTVLDASSVNAVADLGGRFVVSPDANPDVIARTVARGMVSLPGVFTATECFSAIRAGAHALKLFPGDIAGPGGVKALKAVLPDDLPFLVVGGVNAENAKAFRAAGAEGFGIGSALYKPGMTASEVGKAARGFVAALRD